VTLFPTAVTTTVHTSSLQFNCHILTIY